jgi:hydroxymethylpyrimidine kinase/phosphomethylpyrimidine kinase
MKEVPDKSLKGSIPTRTSPAVCMSVAGLDPSGGAGVLADVRTFQAFRCFPAAVITSITFQNTQGVYGALAQTAEAVRGQADPVFDDYEVAAVKTGMLPTEEVIRQAAVIFRRRGVKKIVVDPVVRSTSGFDLIDDEALAALVTTLFPISLLVTPNIPEAERISGIGISGEGDIVRAARAMRNLGAENVLIKGGHLAGPDGDPSDAGQRLAKDYLFIGDRLAVLQAPYF